MAKPRACGTCNACCVALHVTEYDKPAHVPCKHLSTTGKGCGDYNARKPVCGAFECAWLQGTMPAEMRPDRSGIIVWGPQDLIAQSGTPLLSINECVPRALSRPENLRFLQSVSKTQALLVTPMRGGQAVLGPEGAANKVRLAILKDEPELLECDVEVGDAEETPSAPLTDL
jgi:hypothetical protein